MVQAANNKMVFINARWLADLLQQLVGLGIQVDQLSQNSTL
jgi:hypothetical protein